jgi:hypothetical protein
MAQMGRPGQGRLQGPLDAVVQRQQVGPGRAAATRYRIAGAEHRAQAVADRAWAKDPGQAERDQAGTADQ